MTAVTEALRLEMAPFGAILVTVNNVAISTNILADGIDSKLPATSWYKGNERRSQVEQEERMGRHEWESWCMLRI